MLQFVNRQLPIRFGNATLAMPPFGLDAIEPGTLGRQGAHHDATAAIPLDATLVRLEPRPHGLADRATRHYPTPAAAPFCLPPPTGPSAFQKLGRHRTDRTTVDKVQEQALCVSA